MVRNFGLISERELEQTHISLMMGGMRDCDCERVLKSTVSRPDYWSTQREKDKDIESLTSVRKNATDYVPDHTARRDWHMLQRAIAASLAEDLVPQVAPSQVAAQVPAADRVVMH